MSLTTVARCRSCKAAMVWAHTEQGKAMPFDAVPVEGGKWLIEDGIARYQGEELRVGYVPHWAVCPDAAKWRSRT